MYYILFFYSIDREMATSLGVIKLFKYIYMKTKICCDCKQVLPATNEYFSSIKRKNSISLFSKCKKCICKRVKEYYKIHKEEIKERKKQYYIDNKEKLAKKASIYFQKNIKNNQEKYREFLNKGKKYQEKRKVYLNKYSKEQRENLTDYYIICSLIYNNNKMNKLIKSTEIPKEIIKVKREQLKLHRLCHIQNN